ncbi:MAG: hypothetical protein GQ468_05295 [Candidatus Scalindua sp.]|nr:hypothetical protein [Candidatus Scalindua sp.]
MPVTDDQRYNFLKGLSPKEYQALFILKLEGMNFDELIDRLITTGKKVTVTEDAPQVTELRMSPEQAKRFQNMMSLQSPTMQLLADYAVKAHEQLDASNTEAVEIGLLEFLMLMVDISDNQQVAFQGPEAVDTYYGMLYFVLEKVLRGGFAVNIGKQPNKKGRLDA